MKGGRGLENLDLYPRGDEKEPSPGSNAFQGSETPSNAEAIWGRYRPQPIHRKRNETTSLQNRKTQPMKTKEGKEIFRSSAFASSASSSKIGTRKSHKQTFQEESTSPKKKNTQHHARHTDGSEVENTFITPISAKGCPGRTPCGTATSNVWCSAPACSSSRMRICMPGVTLGGHVTLTG